MMEEKVEWSNKDGKWGCKYIKEGVSSLGYSYDKDQAYRNAKSKWAYNKKKKEEKK